MRRRVVITGMGVCSPLGNTLEAFSEALFAGRSAIRLLECVADNGRIAVPAAVASFEPEAEFSKLELTTLDRFSQMALLAGRQALADYPADLYGARTGVYLGCGMGGAAQIDTTYRDLFLKGVRRVRPVTVINIMANAAAGHLAIRHGYIDAAVAGGAEALLVYGAVHSWNALGVLAKPAEDVSTSCRPFSADRSGLVLGEGAALLLLEAEEQALARGATILAEVVGYGDSCDASHLTKPAAEGQVRAMRGALADAGLVSGSIGYINAHGTATRAGDVEEASAIRQVFASPPPVSASKSIHGHLLGASGALECVATVCALREQRLPPTMHLNAPDPQCDLDFVPNRSRAASFDYALTNSFAFGGSNASIILRR